VAGLLAAAPALADQTITAGPLPNSYASSSATMDQGESVSFQNSDQTGALHDVTADANGADGKALFKSATIEKGKKAPVTGVEFLTSGDYAFHCSVHTFMKATLHVTANGKPRARPTGPAPDTTPPSGRVSILDARIGPVVQRGALRVRLASDEPARFKVTATVGRSTVAAATLTLKGARRDAALRLTSPGRKLLSKARQATIKLSAVVTDGANNRGAAAASRTLKR
jgi:plastocyanin